MYVELYADTLCMPDALLVLLDGDQFSYHRIGTGDTVAKMPPAETPDPSELLDIQTVEFAVVGGGEPVDDGVRSVWDGGKILERVEITVGANQ